MKKLIIIINLFIFALTLQAQDLKVYIDKKGRCGYTDKHGEIVIKCKYEIAFPFEDGIAKVSKDGKFGFINSDGKEILPINYEEVTLWGDGIYRIKSGDKYGLFSITDGILQKPQYTCISKLNQYGKAIITSGGKNYGGRIIDTKIGIIDNDGNIAIKPEYDKISELKELSTLAPDELFQSKERLFIGTQSKTEKALNDAMKNASEKAGLKYTVTTVTIGIHLDDTLKTAVEYLCCHKGKKQAVVDKKGKPITPFLSDCTFLTPSFDMFPFRYGTKKVTTGYYNLRTKKNILIGKNVKIKKQVIYSTPFTGDVALVAQADAGATSYKYYFIDKSGEKVSEDFSLTLYKGGYWVVTNLAGDKKAMMDGDGKLIMEFGEYNDILPHDNGKQFTVKDNSGMCGVIDIDKNEIIPFQYSLLKEPVNGWYWATSNNRKVGIIDETGSIIVPFEFYELFLNNSKDITNVWVRKEANGPWNNYSIEKGEIIGEETINSSNYMNNYAWVVPKDQKVTNNAIHKALTALYLSRTKNSYGILIDKEGNYKTTIPIPIELFPTMADALNANNGTLTPLQEKEVIYKATRCALKYELSTTIAEEFWNF